MDILRLGDSLLVKEWRFGQQAVKTRPRVHFPKLEI
jgi:hypothetical protein